MSERPATAEPGPPHPPRRFVAREEVIRMSRAAPALDIEGFRADQEAAIEQYRSEPPQPM